MKAHALFFFLGLTVAGLFALFLRFSFPNRPPEPQLTRIDAVQQLKNVLKLGVIETRISQIYSVRRDNLKIRQIPVPWTGQKSIIAVKGAGQIGYDLEKAEIISNAASKSVEVRLPDPAILSLDLDFHFVQEEDTFLRRLTADDHTKILEEVKKEVRRDLLSNELKSQVEKRAAELTTDFAKIYSITIQLKKKTTSS